MSNQMPYKVVYSLGQQNCRRCSQNIELNQLQIAIMMQVNIIFSSFENYFEFCLWNRNKISTKKIYISSMSDVLKCHTKCEIPDENLIQCLLSIHLVGWRWLSLSGVVSSVVFFPNTPSEFGSSFWWIRLVTIHRSTITKTWPRYGFDICSFF